MDSWYFNDCGQQRGPLPKSEILTMRAEGRIGADTLVWSQGMSEWQPAGSVPALQTPAEIPASSVRETSVSPYAPPASTPDVAVDWNDYTPSGSQIRPWVRYWARTLDLLSFAIFIGIVIGVVDPKILELIPETLLGFVIILAYNFTEPAMLATFGATPFKALLRVRVRNHDGSKLSYFQALRRTFSVLVFGQGLGIPIVALITSIASYSRLTNHHTTRWDEAGGTVVSHQTVQWWRWLLVIAGFVAFFWVIRLGREA